MAKNRNKLKPIPCPNCGKNVPYGSYHCRGRDEMNATWVCKPPKMKGITPDKIIMDEAESIEWDIDANLPLYTRDYLKMKEE